MDGDLTQACTDLGRWLAVAEALLAQPDEQPKERAGSTPFSRPPWNGEVASALFQAHADIRDLESEMRLEVTGTVRRNSDRPGNTGAVLTAIASMGVAVTRPHCDRAVRKLTRLALAIRRLPAVDEALRWERIRPTAGAMPPACPFCECFSLRVAVQAGLVACFNPECYDENGERAQGRLDISRLDGSPILAWGSA